MELFMKKSILSVAAVLFAVSAQANTVCDTNINKDIHMGNTDISIVSLGGNQVEIILMTSDGIGHFASSPKIFNVTAQSYGPEIVKYVNQGEGFELEVNYQPIGGRIRGTFTYSGFPIFANAPVVCTGSAN